MTECEVDRATEDDIDSVAQLFDAYRQFYGHASDYDAAKAYLLERLAENDSVIFLARVGRATAGFTQLYPSFSSVSMQKIWILNDLFVADAYRRSGVAKKLLRTAAVFARESLAARMVLATATTNAAAKRLYEQTGWEKDHSFDHYLLPLS